MQPQIADELPLLRALSLDSGLLRGPCAPRMLMNKRDLLDKIIAHLACEVKALTGAALATHAEATNEENKAEDKYDTRGLEASYLAHGQSMAAEEAALALLQFEALAARDFAKNEPIQLGAFVVLSEKQGSENCYFLGPRAGGTEVEIEGRSVVVITALSPMGRLLMGKSLGERVLLELDGKRRESRIAVVS